MQSSNTSYQCALASELPPAALLLLQGNSSAGGLTNPLWFTYAASPAYLGTEGLPLHVVPGLTKRIRLHVLFAGEVQVDVVAVQAGGTACRNARLVSQQWIECTADPVGIVKQLNASALGADDAVDSVRAMAVPLTITIRGFTAALTAVWPAGALTLPALELTGVSSDPLTEVTQGQGITVFGSHFAPQLWRSAGDSVFDRVTAFALVRNASLSNSNATALLSTAAVIIDPASCIRTEVEPSALQDDQLNVICTVPEVPFPDVYRFVVVLVGYDGFGVIASGAVTARPLPRLHVALSIASSVTAGCNGSIAAVFAQQGYSFALPSIAAGGSVGGVSIYRMCPPPLLTAWVRFGAATLPPPPLVTCDLTADAVSVGDSAVRRTLTIVGGTGAKAELEQHADDDRLQLVLDSIGLSGAPQQSNAWLRASCSALLNQSRLDTASAAVLPVVLGFSRARWVNDYIPDGALPALSASSLSSDANFAPELLIHLQQCANVELAGGGLLACEPLQPPANGTQSAVLELQISASVASGCTGAQPADDAARQGLSVLGSNATVPFSYTTLSHVWMSSNSTVTINNLGVSAPPLICVALAADLVWHGGVGTATGASAAVTRPTRLPNVTVSLLASAAATDGLYNGVDSGANFTVTVAAAGNVRATDDIACTVAAVALPSGLAMILAGETQHSFRLRDGLVTFAGLAARIPAEAGSAVVASTTHIQLTATCTYRSQALPLSSVTVPHIRLALQPSVSSGSVSDFFKRRLMLPVSVPGSIAPLTLPAVQLTSATGFQDAPNLANASVLTDLLGVVQCTMQVEAVTAVRSSWLPANAVTSEPSLSLQGDVEASMGVEALRGGAVAAVSFRNIWLEADPNLLFALRVSCRAGDAGAGSATGADQAVIADLLLFAQTDLVAVVHGPGLGNAAFSSIETTYTTTGAAVSLPFQLLYQNHTALPTLQTEAGSISDLQLLPAAFGVTADTLPASLCDLQHSSCSARVSVHGQPTSYLGVTPDGRGAVSLAAAFQLEDTTAEFATCQVAAVCSFGTASVASLPSALVVRRLVVGLSHLPLSSIGAATSLLPLAGLVAIPTRPGEQQLPFAQELVAAVSFSAGPLTVMRGVICNLAVQTDDLATASGSVTISSRTPLDLVMAPGASSLTLAWQLPIITVAADAWGSLAITKLAVSCAEVDNDAVAALAANGTLPQGVPATSAVGWAEITLAFPEVNLVGLTSPGALLRDGKWKLLAGELMTAQFAIRLSSPVLGWQSLPPHWQRRQAA
jgi:hypothetical protein